MYRTPSLTSIQSSQQLSQSITSNSTIKSEVGHQTLSSLKMINNNNNKNNIQVNESSRREQKRYQKKIQMFSSSIKDRIIPKNVCERSSAIVATSQKNSRGVGDLSTTYNPNSSSQNFQDYNLSMSKYHAQGKDQYTNLNSYPTILSSSRCQQSGLIQSDQSRKENRIHIHPAQEDKQQQVSAQGQSSRDYTYRSMQSTHLNSGEQSNKFSLIKQQSSQSPIKPMQQPQLTNQQSTQQDQPLKTIDFSFKNVIAFNNDSSSTHQKQVAEQSFSQLKLAAKNANISTAGISEVIPRQPFMKCQAFTEERVRTEPDNYQKDDSCISDLSLSRIEYQQESRAQSLKQSNVVRNSVSFNFHQPTIIFNDDIYSKKNSINSNSNYLNFITSAALNNVNQHRSSYSSSIQYQESKFIKSLINKLHQINQETHQNGSVSDSALEASIQGVQIIQNEFQNKQNENQNKQNEIQNKKNQSIDAQNEGHCIQKEEYCIQKEGNNQQNQITPNKSIKIQNNDKSLESIENFQMVKKYEITPIKCAHQIVNNVMNNNISISPQKQITIIRNNSQKSFTPIKTLHQKSFSQTNLNNITKYSTQNSFKLTRESTLNSDFNEVQQTEFSCVSPISKGTISAFAAKQKDKRHFSLPKQGFIAQNNTNYTPESQLNTARLQKEQGWKCC